MFRDAQGLELTCARPRPPPPMINTIDGYLLNRFNVSQRLKSCSPKIPTSAWRMSCAAPFSMMSFNETNVDFARTSLAKAQPVAPRTSPREQAHVAAL